MPMLNRPPRSEMQAATPQTRIGVACSSVPAIRSESPKAPRSSVVKTMDRVLVDQQDDHGAQRQREQDRQRLAGKAREAVAHARGLRHRGSLVAADAGHHEADALLADALAGDVAHDAAVEHDQDAVGERHQLVELHGNQQDGAPFGALAHDLGMDRLRARRCRRRGSAGRSAGSARRRRIRAPARPSGCCRPTGSSRPRRRSLRADVEALDQLHRSAA